jgi:Arc/MetJ-type ribon-helix-helix transcriptional regulator
MMPKKKRFEISIHVNLPAELAEFLEEMVRKGAAETISQAARKCIAIAKEYLPEISVKAEEKPEVAPA